MDHTNQLLSLIGEGGPYTHEEADVVIINYLLQLIQQGKNPHTGVSRRQTFSYCCCFSAGSRGTSAYLTIRKYNDKVIDIKTTVDKLGEKCLDLLAAHALSGCDSVSYPFGKGKIKAINLVLNSEVTLKEFVNPVVEEEEAWIEEGLSFLSKLYGGRGMTSLAELKCSIFSKKKDPPKIKSLTPTDNAAVQHIRRARLQEGSRSGGTPGY